MSLYKLRLFLSAIVLTYVSFSPLIEVEIKLALFSLFSVINVFFINTKRSYSFPIHFVFIFVLFIGFFRDLWISSNTTDSSFVGFYFLASLLFPLVTYLSLRPKELIGMIDSILFWGAVCSLIGVGIYTFIPDLIYSFPNYVNRTFVHKTIGITNFLILDIGPVKRNTGFASEPGMWQFLMIVGLVIHLIMRKGEYSRVRIVVFTVAAFSTISTAGLFALLLVVLLLFRKLRSQDKVVVLVFGALLIPVILGAISYHLEYKIGTDSSGFMGRMQPALNILNDHLSLFGKGNVFYDANVQVGNFGSYDSFTQLAVRYGVVGLLIYLILLALPLATSKRVLVIPILATSLSQAIWFYPLTLILLLLCWENYEKYE